MGIKPVLGTVGDMLKSNKDARVSKADKLKEIAAQEGYEDIMDYLEDEGMDSIITGICMTADCDYTTGVEPDQDRGWCEECEKGTVQSALVLMGII